MGEKCWFYCRGRVVEILMRSGIRTPVCKKHLKENTGAPGIKRGFREEAPISGQEQKRREMGSEEFTE